MSKRTGIIFVTIGVALVLSALLLFAYNRYEEYCAGREAEQLLHDIQNIIDDQRLDFGSQGEKTGTAEIETGDTEAEDIKNEGKSPEIDHKIQEGQENDSLATEMPMVTIDGYDYIGYLSIPELQLELPVMAEWDYKRLKIAPCRHSGSTVTDNLVIAAHNYKTHFGSISKLENGTRITFTDMAGQENSYLLETVVVLAPDAVEEVLDSGYELVLYTCTPGGASRVVAFCRRTTEEKPVEEQEAVGKKSE